MEEFAEFMRRREAASNDWIRGDPATLAALVTDRDPASFLPPSGAVVLHPDAVREAQVAGAAHFGPGSTGRFDVIDSGSSGDLGFWIGRQVAVMDVPGRDSPAPTVLRVTEVFRREAGEWRLAHRHADAAAPQDG